MTLKLSATRTPTSSTLMYAGRSRAASSASSHLTLAVRVRAKEGLLACFPPPGHSVKHAPWQRVEEGSSSSLDRLAPMSEADTKLQRPLAQCTDCPLHLL